MKLTVGWIGKTKSQAIQSLTDEYLKRISYYADVEGKSFKDEEALLAAGGKNARSAKPRLILLDSQGKQLSSEEWAQLLGQHQDRNPLPLCFAIGPASGFSDPARRAAATTLSLGKVTIAHELARVVLLEQLYRAFTILKGHPYHTGH